MTDLVIRPLTAGEEPLFESLADPALVGPGAFGDRYSDGAARREYRPEWTWVALRGTTVAARAAWFGGPSDKAPLCLDWLDFTDPPLRCNCSAPCHCAPSTPSGFPPAGATPRL